MARLFDNNAANYMSRGSVNLGFNGATACSFAFWVNLTALNITAQQSCIAKPFTTDHTLNARFTVNASTLTLGFDNTSLSQWPTWVSNTSLGTGSWTRVLFAWARSAGTGADGILYLNGVATTCTFTANGYAGTFTMAEGSNTLAYGIGGDLATKSLNGALAWVCVWNRQLTATEALVDYNDARSISLGRIHCVECNSDTDISGYGNDMTVTGTLADAGFEPTQREGSFLNMAQADYPGAGPKSPAVRFYKSPTGITTPIPSTVVFRKTLSSIGTRTGSRQVQYS